MLRGNAGAPVVLANGKFSIICCTASCAQYPSSIQKKSIKYDTLNFHFDLFDEAFIEVVQSY